MENSNIIQEERTPERAPAVENLRGFKGPLLTLETKHLEIKLVRLLSGEELVGQVSEVLGGIKISKPLQLLVQPPQRPGDRLGIGFTPWLPYAKTMSEDTIFQWHSILFFVNCAPELEAAYRQNVSGLLTPVKKILAP
jgi:hypothetical protein